MGAPHGRGELRALALRFVTLTAARSREVQLASWAEIDGTLWRIPADRTKTGQPHIVPLTEEALAALERARALTDGGG
jgi:integrase